MADIFEEATKLCGKPKKVSNWLMVETLRLIKETETDAEEISFSPVNLASLIELVESGKINGAVAKEVFEQIFKENVNPEEYVKAHGLESVNDEGQLEEIAIQIAKDNPQSVADYKAGKTKAIGFLVGQAMKATKGKANPGALNKLFAEILDKM